MKTTVVQLLEARERALELRTRMLSNPPRSMPTELVVEFIQHADTLMASIDRLLNEFASEEVN